MSPSGDWRQKYGRSLRGDLDALSQFETCFSVAGFVADAGQLMAGGQSGRSEPSFQCTGTRSSTPPSIETPSQRLRDGWNGEDALGDRQQYEWQEYLSPYRGGECSLGAPEHRSVQQRRR